MTLSSLVTLALRILGVLLHQVPHVKLEGLSVHNNGLDVQHDENHAGRLVAGRVAPAVHGAAVDGHVAGAENPAVAAVVAQGQLDLALADGADAESQGAVQVGLGAGGKVDHADDDAVGDVEGGLLSKSSQLTRTIKEELGEMETEGASDGPCCSRRIRGRHRRSARWGCLWRCR